MDGIVTQCGMVTQAGGLSVAPTSWWDLDDLTGTDEAGTLDWTTITGGCYVTSGTGPGGQDCVDIPAPEYLLQSRNPVTEGFTTKFSFAGWCFLKSFNPGYAGSWFFSWRLGGAIDFTTQIFNSENLSNKWQGSGPQGSSPSASSAASLFQWYHLALTFEQGVDCSFYLNGALVDSIVPTTEAIQNVLQPMALGAGSWAVTATTLRMNGRVAMCGMVNDVWTANDIAYLYNSGAGRKFADL
jgi:hypothetical protein